MNKLFTFFAAASFCAAFSSTNSFAKERDFSFSYNVTNKTSKTLMAQRLLSNNRAAGVITYAPSKTITPGQTMKIEGTFRVNGPILREDAFGAYATVIKIGFSPIDSPNANIFTLVESPTYVRGALALPHEICSGYSYFYTNNSAIIVENKNHDECHHNHGS